MIAILTVFTVFMGYHATKIKMSYKLAELVPQSKHESQYFHKFKETFGQDANIMAIGFADSSIYTLKNFQAYYRLCDRIDSLEGLNDVVAIPTVLKLVRNDRKRRFDYLPLFTASPSTEEELKTKLDEFKSIEIYKNQIYNPKNGVTALLVTLKEEYNDSKKRIKLLAEIEAEVDVFTAKTGIKAHYAGLPYIRTTMTKEVSTELRMFLLLSLAVTAIILFVFFRSFSAVFFSVLVIGVAVITTMGTISLFGYDVSLLTGLIPPIIVVIGIPNCVYLLNKYHQEFVKHQNKIKALSTVIRKIGVVTLITNFTTAVGFLVVITADITILREFGVVAGINVLGTFLISIILIPTVFSFLPDPSTKHTKHLEFKSMQYFLRWLEHVVLNRRSVIYTITVVLVMVCLWGSWKVYSVSYMVDDLPEESVIRKDLAFFEQNFGGVMPLEIVLNTHDSKSLKDVKFLQKLDEFQTFLTTIPELSSSVSILNFIKGARQAYWAGMPEFYGVPTNQDKGKILSYLLRSGKEGGSQDMVNNLIDSTGQIRISIKVADVGSKRMDTLVHQVIMPEADRIFKSEVKEGETLITYEITGTTLLFIKGNKYLVKNLREGLVMAIILIALIMAVLFQNIRMILLSIITNLIPLAITGALMGYMDIPLKPSTALIFSIAFGISVDDSIHFLAKYRQELFANKFNVKIAVQKSLNETGASMFYTSIVLFCGFIIFAFSNFGGTVMLGVLTSTTLLCAMITNLILLPSLLMTFDSGKRKASRQTLIDTYISTDEDVEELEGKERINSEQKDQKRTTTSEV